MAEWQLIQDAIAAKLAEVPGIGAITDWAPDITSFKSLKDYLTLTGSRNAQDRAVERVNLWFVEHAGFSTLRGGTQAGVPLGYYQFTENFSITGFYAYTGETSYIAFNNLLHAVREKFVQEIALGYPERNWLSGPADGSIDMGEFFGVVCHTCVLTITVSYHAEAGYR